jgi:hypothetical protein
MPQAPWHMAMPPTDLERAAAEAAELAPPGSRSQAQGRLNGLVRDVRVLAQDLRRSLAEVAGAGALADVATRGAELHAALVEAAAVHDAADRQLAEYFDGMRALFDANADLYDLAGDEVASMRALLQPVARTWPRPPASDDPSALDEAGVIGQTAKATGLLDEVIFHAGLVTIPIRLNAHLRELRIGGALRFDDMFADEVPAAAARTKLLRYIDDIQQPSTAWSISSTVSSSGPIGAAPAGWRATGCSSSRWCWAKASCTR